MTISQDLINKYKDMASIRDDFNNINPKNFSLPTMGEMTEEDLMSSILSDISDNESNTDNDEIIKTAFYSEEPFSTELGYHPDEGVFMLKATDLANDPASWLLNKLDGDTPAIELNAINDGGKGFTIGNKTYSNFKSFCREQGTGSRLGLRLAGINTPEIPHFEIMPFAKDGSYKTKKMKFKDIKSSKHKDKEFMYLKYPIKNYNADATIEEMLKWKASVRKDDEELEFYVNTSNGKEYWYEIRDEFNIDREHIKGANDNYEYRAIVTKEDTELNNVVAGYTAKALVKKKLNQTSEFYLMINANNIEPKKMYNSNEYGIANWWYTTKTITKMMEDWKKTIDDVGTTRLTYSPFGSDIYGRFLTAIYLKVQEGENTVWINLNKYVLANDDAMVEGNPSYSGSPTLDSLFNGVSDAFKLWTYNKENIKWLDSFNNLTSKSYTDKIKLHKQLTGVNFEEAKDCTMMLGDTMLLIPPQNIRNITNNTYQRTATMRGKGSMVKAASNKEQLLEIDCFFYGEDGINGIPFKTTTPSGDTVTYHMNGLRSLISQFKISPFLPIENSYINDTLGIEAVSLQNFYTETVEGIPGLLKAVLTLRDFNYRVYMPDIPVEELDGSITSETSGISNMAPMFAKCFEWELFRFYYQRPVAHGSYINQLGYNSSEYNKELYSVKNTIQPIDNFCDSNISFYIPDQNWLDQALQVKLDRDKNKTNITPVKLNEKALKFMSGLNDLKTVIDDMANNKSLSFDKAISEFLKNHNEKDNKFILTSKYDNKVFKDIIPDRHTSMYRKNNGIVDISKNEMFEKTKTLLNPVMNNLYKHSVVKHISVDEEHQVDAGNNGLYSLKYVFNIYVNLDEYSSSEVLAIKESIKESVDKQNDEILKDSIISIPMVIQFTNSHNDMEYMLSIDSDNTIMLSQEKDYDILTAANKVIKKYETGDQELGENTTDDYLADNVQDYMNPANMPFVPYLEDVLCSHVSGGLTNTFTEISLKAVDGYAPQYIGGQDTRLEVNIITNDELTVAAINTLPQIAIDITKSYRKILTCWPIKIKNNIAQMLGINEVLIDTVDIRTIDDAPGIYDIRIVFTSVDRTQRQREALRQLKSKNNAGHIGTDSYSDISLKTYFSLEGALSQSELYPDLDIPTIDELSQYGFRFIKYSGKNRRYPDPDFYIVYSAPYTAMIIKQMVKEVLSKQVFTDNVEESDNPNVNDMKYVDTMGMELETKIEKTIGYNIKAQNDIANNYDEIVEEVSKEVSKKDKQWIHGKTGLKDHIDKSKDMSDMFNFLTACDILDGWTIKPGWKAPICESYTNKEIEGYIKKSNKSAYAKQIRDLRTDAINLIDNLLSKKIDVKKDGGSNDVSTVIWAVNQFFYYNKDGKALIELLCPSIVNHENMFDLKIANTTKEYNKKFFEKPEFLNFIAGFTYASACAQSGTSFYSGKVKEYPWSSAPWKPNLYVRNEDNTFAEDDKGNKLYRCLASTKGSGNQNTYARSLDIALNSGHTFGPYSIQLLEASELGKITANESVNLIPPPVSNMFKTSEPNKGFMDPYYNNLDSSSEELEEYKKGIMSSWNFSTTAFIRNMLHHLKRLILEGYFISEMDVIARDFSEIEQAINTMYVDSQDKDEQKKNIYKSETSQVSAAIKVDSTVRELTNDIARSLQKSFCARMIYPFMSAITNNSLDFQNIISSRDFESLDAMLLSASLGESSSNKIDKFLRALNGIGLVPENVDAKAEDVSDSQKTFNSLMKDVWIYASEDPRLYVMHSFYDMLINDKRGRLVRAFPTYYVVFIDEGRKIGSWKLHDNFYNMSSISNIQVVKSRKIAADTCNITMSNMYNSYASSHDAETSQTYTDIYGLKDAFENIFSPKAHFDKEEAIRLRKTLPDKVVLQPGVRIHVRLGYTADGSKLPIVFNGKIAELDCSESVDIIAQGDGHELMNPLTAFGELEAQALEEAQDTVNWFKDIRGAISRGGVTPRELMTLVLSANHGGLVKKMWNEWFDGRWFNENPFGITHFGDFRMRDIFEDGEVVQNIYEVSDNTLMKGVNEMLATDVSKKQSPTINTTIQDKTCWDLLHMCANSGLEYYGAVRDFGLRSTIFLGKANHYYAYAYDKIDGKVIEKRKPFQQFHYYDSYTDIVYNSIKASEQTLKTNATGIWQEQKGLWGRGQSTVGPIYLDMNIYPEYQKSMTLDTGLIASGNGGLLPSLDRFFENLSMDANDDKVNKALAWRMTMNGLRQNVKDMYQGELCVIGDPSVKPYDRMLITDSYEDMEGQCEVETVIYSMNVDTGFTTTIVPDVIVRHDDPHENARMKLLSNFAACATVMIGGRLLLNFNAARESKLLRAIDKSDTLYNLTTHTKKTSRALAESTGLAKYASDNPAIEKLLNKMEIGLTGSSLEEQHITKWIEAINSLSKKKLNGLDLSDIKNIDELSDIVRNLGRMDNEEYTKALDKLYNDNISKFGNKFSKEDLEEMIKLSTKEDEQILKLLNIKLGNTHVNKDKGIIELLLNYEKRELFDAETIDALKKIESLGPDITLNNKAAYSSLSEVLKDKHVKELISKSDDLGDALKSSLGGFHDLSNLLFKAGDNGATAMTTMAKGLKGGDKIKDIFMVFKSAASVISLGTVIIELAKITASFVITANAKEMFTRFIQNVQALTIYPMTKSSRPLIAGINGHKGSVFGSPTRDGWNSIQGMIMQTVEMIDNSFFGLGKLVLNDFLDADIYEEVSNKWKQNLGIEEESIVSYGSEKFNQMLYNTVSTELGAKQLAYKALKTRARVQSQDTANGTTPEYVKYKNTGILAADMKHNTNIKGMYYVGSDPDIQNAINKTHHNIKEFIIMHSEQSNATTYIPFENGGRQISYIVYPNQVFDLPLVQEEGIMIINKIINRDCMSKAKVWFKSGARINDKRTWKNTGFTFTLEVKDIKDLEQALQEVQKESMWNGQKMFIYSISNKQAVIHIYPSTVIKNEVKEKDKTESDKNE